MIFSIEINHLRYGEFIRFGTNLADLIEQNDPAALNVIVQHNDFKNSINEMRALYVQARSNPITKELLQLDDSRDNSVYGITGVIGGYLYHYDEAISGAARLLADNLKLYGSGIAKLNYQMETTQVEEIISDWETQPQLLAALTLLGLVEWKNLLKATNQEFDQKYLQRTQQYGAASPVTLKEKSEEAMRAYYELRKFIEAYATINNNSPVYQKAINEINALIEQFNQLLVNRQGNGTEENTEEGETENGEGEEITPTPLP